MGSAFLKDILRTVATTKRRFLSIAAITLLGVVMLVGLRIACQDLRLSADAFFDEQRLYDVSVQSTLGLTDDDVAALSGLDGVEVATGSWGETAYTSVGDARSQVSVAALVEGGMNEPYVLEGRLPAGADEIAVTAEYLEDSGKAIGDTVTFSAKGVAQEDMAEEEMFRETAETEEADAAIPADGNLADDANSADEADTEVFATHTYTITASVIDPASISAKHGSSSFRSTGPRYSFFVTPDAVASPDVFTVIYLRVAGAAELNGFSAEYEDKVAEVTARAEAIKAEREQARTQQVRAEANAKVDDAEAEANAELGDAERQLDDAQRQIDDALAQIAAGKRALDRQGASARAQLESAQRQIDDARAQLAAASAQLDDADAQLAAGADELAQGWRQLNDGQAQLEAAREQLQQAIAAEDALLEGAEQLKAALADQGLGDLWHEDAWQAVRTTTDATASAQAQAEFVAPFREYADTTATQIQTALDLCDQTDALLERLIGGEEGLKEEILTCIDELATQLAQRYPQYADEIGAARDEVAGFVEDTQVLEQARTELAEARAGLEGNLSQLQQLPGQASQLAAGMGQLATSGYTRQAAQDGLAQIAEQQAQLDASRAQLQAGQNAYDAAYPDARRQIDDGRAQVASGLAQLDAGQAELGAQRARMEEQLAAAARELADGEAEAADGQAELDANRAIFEQKKADALAKIAEARDKVADLEEAVWYIQDRSAISSYASIDSDASSIEAIATVFPAIFLTVAILVSLTTATRMVEEERGLIGLYKALGYGRGRIMGKYVSYTLAASLLGGVVGAVLGFVALPEFLFSVFRVMYVLPELSLHFDAGLCLLAIGLFAAGITLATLLTCKGELAEQPATLMRPKAPRAGSRILLERVRPVWNRLDFLNKVTARNLFRYKRRLLMTVFGVMGCTALMICGFAISDTVLALSPNQYGDSNRAGVYDYDLMAVTQPEDLEDVATQLTDDTRVEDYVPVRTENVTVEHDGAKETVQLVVVPDGFSLEGYVELRGEDGSTVELVDGTSAADTADGDVAAGDGARDAQPGVLITKNAAVVLGFGKGDELALQDTALNAGTARVDGVVMNYLGNVVYMTQDTYEQLFGVPLEANAALAHLAGDADAQIAFAHELASEPELLSVTSVQEGIRDFATNFMLINYVVVLITALAAGLAFVVLFTLSTTNISERERELATIKVLGFRRGEVRTYINKETFLLTLMGTALGVPAGTLLGHALTYVLNMPSMYFAVEIHVMSYVWSCGLSLVFAVVVSLITNRTLDRVDMVGALKSAE